MAYSGEVKCLKCGLWQIPRKFCPECGYDFSLSPTFSTNAESYHKVKIPEGSSIDWLIASGADKAQIQAVLDKESKIREVTQAYEKYMGFNPLEWGKMERLQRFLLTKSVEEIKTFAKWCRREYSTLTPAKARQYPNLVIDCWPQAFEKQDEVGVYDVQQKRKEAAWKELLELEKRNGDQTI